MSEAYNAHVHAAFSCIDWKSPSITLIECQSEDRFNVRFVSSNEVCMETIAHFVQRANASGLNPTKYYTGKEASSGFKCCIVSFNVPP